MKYVSCMYEVYLSQTIYDGELNGVDFEKTFW